MAAVKTKRPGAATKPKSPTLSSSEIDALLLLIPGYNPQAQAGNCVFDYAAANRVLTFFATVLKHSKGAKAGKPFELEPWQKSTVANLFGWKRPDGTRRYRECLIYIAKKNGKSAFVAGLILYMLGFDGEAGCEVFSAASSRDQAALIFGYAAGMVRAHPKLKKCMSVFGDQGGSQMRSITFASTMSAYRCLSADANTADGVNPHFVAVDEIHRHKSPQLAEVLQKSTAARLQPMVIYTTTADYNRPSLCNTKLAYARTVRDNKGDTASLGYDPGFLPVIFECPKECVSDGSWKTPAVWRLANPNMGVTLSEEFLARECQKAQEMPSELNNFLRLHLNIVTDSDVAWLPADLWDANKGVIVPEELAGRVCYGALDLSSKIDLTAWVKVFPPLGEADPWIIAPTFWVPADTAIERERKDRVPYGVWIQQGFLERTPGSAIDYEFIKQRVRDDAKLFRIQEVAFDPWNAMQIAIQLGEEGIKCVEFGQGYKSMSEPSKEFEKLLRQKRIAHGGHPVLRWMAGNVMLEIDPAGNIKPSKAKSPNKIDGIVGAVMGLGRAILKGGVKPSKYEREGLMVVG